MLSTRITTAVRLVDGVAQFTLMLRLYLNGGDFITDTYETENEYFEDSSQYKHLIGKGTSGHSFRGFIGDVWFSNYQRTNFGANINDDFGKCLNCD